MEVIRIIHEVNTQKVAYCKWRQKNLYIRKYGERSQLFIHFEIIKMNKKEQQK